MESSIAQIRELLKNPNPAVLEKCAPHLDEAARHLRFLVESGPFDGKIGSAMQVRALTLQREIRSVGASIESCAAFYLGWVEVLSGLAGAYTPDGVRLLPEPGMQVFTQG
ncbi:MAG: hypothetical protein U0Q18_09560 [Bryobacteraceae bacterium]